MKKQRLFFAKKYAHWITDSETGLCFQVKVTSNSSGWSAPLSGAQGCLIDLTLDIQLQL